MSLRTLANSRLVDGAKLDNISISGTKLGTTVAVADNVTAATFTQNDTTNNPVAVRINSTTSGAATYSLFVNTDGNQRSIYIDSESTTQNCVDVDASTITTAYGFQVITNNASFSGVVSRFEAIHSSSTGKVGSFVNAGTGDTVFVDVNGNSAGIVIDSEATTGIPLDIDAPIATTNAFLRINNGATSKFAIMQDDNITGSNGAAIRLGNNYYIWVDNTGDLRIKSGAPSSDTDGTIVGTQS